MSFSSESPSVDAAQTGPASTTAVRSAHANTNAAPAAGANLRLALILASIAAAFFVGIVVKYVFFPAP